MIQTGATRVLCAASVEDGVPGFLRGQKRGWVTDDDVQAFSRRRLHATTDS